LLPLAYCAAICGHDHVAVRNEIGPGSGLRPSLKGLKEPASCPPTGQGVATWLHSPLVAISAADLLDYHGSVLSLQIVKLHASPVDLSSPF